MRRVIGGTRKSKRISVTSLQNMCPSIPQFGNNEMDTHADTCVLGKNFIITQYTGRECDVVPYSDDYEAVTGVPIVTGATAWTDQNTGETWILLIHEALWMEDTMTHSLINPNQLRAYGVDVEDNPSRGPLYITDSNENIRIPLRMQGTNILFESRTPTQDELENCRKIEFSSQHEWQPATIHEKFHNVAVGAVNTKANCQHDDQQLDGEEDEIYNPDSFSRRLIKSVQVSLPSPQKTNISAILSDTSVPPTFSSEDRRAEVTPQTLSDRWMVGLQQATLTLKNTTQRYVRSALLPLARRYKADRIFHLPRLQGEWFTDTVFGRVKSKDGNTCGQIFANESYFATFYPMDTKSKAGDALRVFCREFGVPERLVHDGAKEMTGRKTEFQAQVSKHDITTRISEADLHDQSPAEGVVREVRRKWFRVMFRKRVPKIFWDYGMRWVCETMSRTYLRNQRVDGGVPLTKVTGETVDISPYIEFGFYDRVWFRDNAGLGPQMPGRWLGVATNVGGMMCYYVLQQNGQVTARSTVWNPTNLELQTDEIKATFTAFDTAIDTMLKDDEFPVEGDKPDPETWADLATSDEDFRDEFFTVYANPGIKEADDEIAEPSPGIMDEDYSRMELALPRNGNGPELARVKKRLKDNDGKPIGVANANPILDTRVFEVEFLDGHTVSMTANAIAESLFAQVDSEGRRLLLIDEIVDHRKSGEAVDVADGFITTKSGKKKRRQTTKGWELLVRWKDGSETWNALKDLKESFIVLVAEYAVQNRIHEEPAFAWWVPHVIKKRDRIVAKVKSKYWQKTHKYGIEIPKSVVEAKRLDEKNGNTLWWDSICQEMANVMVAFKEYEGEGVPKGFAKIQCHIVFDVKLGENFRRKARLVAQGNRTEDPDVITFSSVVSRDSVRICLLIAALNGLDLKACDIKNAYLTAPNKEKVYVVAGPEFGPELQGRILIVERALYGLKSAGAAFRSYLAEHLWSLDYRPSYADPDVWLRPAVKADGSEYYEMLLCYVDDILCISIDPMKTMSRIKDKFELKNDEVKTPSDYLGGVLEQMTNENGVTCWSQSSDKYIQAAITNVEEKLKESGRELQKAKHCSAPFQSSYRPELDTTAELALEGHRYYQELIGVLRWAVELGRLDILLETALLSAFLASPREGHLEAVYHMFGYLKSHPKRKIAFDPEHPQIDQRRYQKYDWTDFYRGAVEALPGNAPPSRGKSVSMSCFVDANLAGDTVGRRSQTGILIFVNRAPILWHSKRQNTVESSTFGSEIVALKNAIELIEGLRYKLRMFGVTIDGPADIFCDNEAVVKNCSTPESVLKKKHHSIAYHRNREAVAAGTVRIVKEDTETNLADVFTKIMSAAQRDPLFDRFMY
jgi:Reverse transcriptase (RNA-dependent DNA polymerase)